MALSATVFVLSCVILLGNTGVYAGNPIVPHVGMADTNVHFFNDTFYIFATHDFSPQNHGFLMKDWWCWSSMDLVNWKIDSIVQPNVTVKWSTSSEQNECWATDAAFRNNKFYFYLSVGGSEVGVVMADSTKGPWKDPLGKPLLSSDMARHQNPSTTFRDPCVFEDDDGDFYIIAGVFHYYVAKLGEDMISLAETLKHVVVNNAYGPCGNGTTDDKPFIHKNNHTYYLSWGCFYATSTSIYGPYETQGAVISTSKLDPSFRMNDTETTGVRNLANDLANDSSNDSAGGSPRSPQVGDGIILYTCDNATAAEWTATPSFQSGKNFSIQLKQDPTLCITGPKKLNLQKCAATINPHQQFTVVQTSEGVDIKGDSTCPCWNVNDFNARAAGNRGVIGNVVQCFNCVDGANFNPNQRFQIMHNSQIGAWDGYAKGFCVAVDYPGNPTPLPPPSPPSPPPPPKPWYRYEDYTDRHGSFLQHGGQWYYASNDRSHSNDKQNPAFFRDTVLCYIHFYPNATMEPCVVNAVGVGTYDGAHPIEAENYFTITGNAKKMFNQHQQVFVVRLSDGGVIHFPHIFNLPQTTWKRESKMVEGEMEAVTTMMMTRIKILVATYGYVSGTVRVSADAVGGKVLGSCEVNSAASASSSSSSSSSSYLECDLVGVADVTRQQRVHLVLQFVGRGLIDIDHISFEEIANSN